MSPYFVLLPAGICTMSSPKTPQLQTTTEIFLWRPSAPSQRFSSGETRMTALCLSKCDSHALLVLKTPVVRHVQKRLLHAISSDIFVFSLLFEKASFDEYAVSLCHMILMLHYCHWEAAEAPSSRSMHKYQVTEGKKINDS